MRRLGVFGKTEANHTGYRGRAGACIYIDNSLSIYKTLSIGIKAPGFISFFTRNSDL
jgi:hypothetical protein